MTRVRRRVDVYLVESPGPNLSEGAEEVGDLAPPRERDPYEVAVAALGHSNPKRMAIDVQLEDALPEPASLSTRELRDERDRLNQILSTRPRAETHAWRRVAEQLADLEG
ncbi:MAG: hypothetical protein ACRDZO_08320 [Egibacteraceae bacterium]